jgi:nitrate reductase gamma subunit
MCVLHFIRLIRLGAPKDLSEVSGNITAGVIYSNTGAMLPKQKESAYRHLPTYTAGICFHIGTFVALLCFIMRYFDAPFKFLSRQYTLFSISVLLIILGTVWLGTCCGFGLIIKRLLSKKLRPISNADDYISLILTALFQFSTALLFTAFAFPDFSGNRIIIFYIISSTLLFFYLPFGKLKHVVYYFSARYHLGFFYGRRGTWPPTKKNKI